MTTVIPFSEACERNKDPILEIITPYLNAVDRVLEIGTGTAQHALHFAQACPHLTWQTTDQSEYLEGIRAQLQNTPQSNVLEPFELDVNQIDWLAHSQDKSAGYPLLYTANTFHIMTEQDVIEFFAGLPKIVSSHATLIVYGPFSYQGKFTSLSNAEFDQRLRQRGVGSGIRDIDFLTPLANQAGFKLKQDVAMPANNQILVWQKS